MAHMVSTYMQMTWIWSACMHVCMYVCTRANITAVNRYGTYGECLHANGHGLGVYVCMYVYTHANIRQ